MAIILQALKYQNPGAELVFERIGAVASFDISTDVVAMKAVEKLMPQGFNFRSRRL